MQYIYDEYRDLLLAFIGGGYRIVTVHQAATEPVDPPFLILRHDVEWSAKRAVAIAAVEEKLGVRSTLYFRVDTGAHDVATMRALQRRGFDIGYHYNTLDRTHGDCVAAGAMFEREVADLRRAGVHVSTAVPHGNPTVRRCGYNFNSDLLKRDPGLLHRLALLDIGPFGTSFPMQGKVFQVSDANMRWNRGDVSWRFFYRIARDCTVPRLFLLVHCDYWSASRVRATLLHTAAAAMRALRLRSAAPRFRRGPYAWRWSPRPPVSGARNNGVGQHADRTA
jgi:hypothetical protein